MCGIALLPHHRASLAPPSTNNCAFGHDFREAALTNTGRPWPDSHRKVVRCNLSCVLLFLALSSSPAEDSPERLDPRVRPMEWQEGFYVARDNYVRDRYLRYFFDLVRQIGPHS